MVKYNLKVSIYKDAAIYIRSSYEEIGHRTNPESYVDKEMKWYQHRFRAGS
jgi:hypothetical protein